MKTVESPPALDIAALFTVRCSATETDAAMGRRQGFENCTGEFLRDEIHGHGATCLFIRLNTSGSEEILTLSGRYRIISTAAGGWLLCPGEDGQPLYWLPVLATLRRLAPNGHILSEQGAPPKGLDLNGDVLNLILASNTGEVVDLPIWQLPPELAQEFQVFAPLETQPVFLWGSHTPYACPADLYIHLIHGWAYENRYAWPHKRKICSENDAHALYVTLHGLEQATGKALYRLLKKQLLLSVLSRQSEDGGFRHGEWSEHMESHYRLHVSAMHLMMDALSEEDDPAVRVALTRAANFIAARTDHLNVGTWFLHDELEENASAMDTAPFRWLRSRALGKRESNMLVLNTQLDTSVALDRYMALTGDTRHAATVASARKATQAVLALRPAELLYKLLFQLISLTFLPTYQAAALPIWKRALKRITWRYLLPHLPDLKARFPRLVMPGGYVDRELTLRTWAHHYLSINLMDLARYQRRLPSEDVLKVALDAAAFTHGSGILARWAELKYEKYALGFWAEALYHLCLLEPSVNIWRTWLAEAILLLEDTDQGLPPSLLGANAEAIPPADQVPCLLPGDERLRVVNLSRRGHLEWMVVNPRKVPLALTWGNDTSTTAAASVAWHNGGGDPAVTDGPIPPRAWLWGKAP